MLFPWFSSKVQASNGDIRPAELVYVIIHSTINGFKFVMCEGLLLAGCCRSVYGRNRPRADGHSP
jgi:hypothetical protein